MTEINLIAKKRNILLRSKKLIKTVRIISFSILALTVLSAVIVFFIKLSSPLASLKDQEKTILSELAASKSKIAEISVIKDRTKYIAGIISKRQNLDQKVSLVTDSLGNVSLSTMDIDGKKITMTATSSSLDSINIFLDKLVGIYTDKKIFKNVMLGNLGADLKTGKYTIAVSAQLL